MSEQETLRLQRQILILKHCVQALAIEVSKLPWTTAETHSQITGIVTALKDIQPPTS